jgi:hypothetical protein
VVIIVELVRAPVCITSLFRGPKWVYTYP